MKALLIPLAACAVLSGCATYGDPYYQGYGYGYGYPSTTIGVYPTYQHGVYQTYPTYPAYPAYRNDGRGYRDRDRDGIPNRMDPDRDNDGVPNSYDSRPNNPRRR
jgi:hypothetical protein